MPNPMNPYQKKMRWSKKGGGGVSVFLLKVKKTVFYASPKKLSGKQINWVASWSNGWQAE